MINGLYSRAGIRTHNLLDMSLHLYHQTTVSCQEVHYFACYYIFRHKFFENWPIYLSTPLHPLSLCASMVEIFVLAYLSCRTQQTFFENLLGGHMSSPLNPLCACMVETSMPTISSVFWLLIRQFKFLGTIEFQSRFGFKIFKYCRPFAPCKNLSYKSMKASCQKSFCVYGLPFPFCIIDQKLNLKSTLKHLGATCL